MTKETRALIEAAEAFLNDVGHRPKHLALDAAISSAKAAEEGVEAKWRTPMIPEYLLNDARREYESLETGIKVTGWNPPGTWPELQNVPVECIVNIYQKGVIAQTVVTTGIYEDEKDGPDFHPNLPSADMWGGIDVVLWREVREKEGL